MTNGHYPKTIKMSPRTTSFCILVGAILVAFVCSILLVSSLLFAVGVAISWFHIPLAAALAAGFGWWIAKFYFPKETVPAFGLAFGSSVVVFISFALLNGKIYDISWDGQTYHAEAIVQLANGWNPFREEAPAGVLSEFLSFYAKGPWICAAALYKFTGSFETGKAFHLTLILACWLFSVAALSTFREIRWQWMLILSLLVAFNPVSICQMFTYYVDGQLFSLLGIAVSLLILRDRRPDRVFMALLAGVVILTINVKLNGAIYIAIIAGGYWLWYAIAKKAQRAELAAWLVSGAAVGGFFVGFNPYVTQYATKLITTGNPFYPTDWESLTRIASNMPEYFTSMGRLERLFVSLFSRSEIVPRTLQFKLPFTFSWSELQAFVVPDVRVGGFGPLFAGALLLTIAILALLIWKYRQHIPDTASMFVLMALLFISGLSSPAMWWARYAPQIWMIPVISGVIGLLVIRHGRWRSLVFALLLTLSVNNLLIFFPYMNATFRGSQQVHWQLKALKSQREPITAQFNRFAGTRYRFEREGIGYVEVETLPCREEQKNKVVWSQALICKPW